MADQINVNEPQPVSGNDGGMSGLVWVIVIVLLLIIGYFIFVASRDRDEAIEVTVPTETEQDETFLPEGDTDTGTDQ
jgi:hypothetical protein